MVTGHVFMDMSTNKAAGLAYLSTNVSLLSQCVTQLSTNGNSWHGIRYALLGIS